MPDIMPHAPPSRPPPFCPYPDCDSRKNSEPWRYKKKGFFTRSQKTRRVQRYGCHHCGRTFSSQTFQTDYCLRRGDLLEPLLQRLGSSASLRQIARELGISHSTVRRLTERLENLEPFDLDQN